MRLSELLVAKNLISLEDVENAIARQKREGGPFADNLLALDLISIVDLHSVLESVPETPATIEETGLRVESLLKLLTKSIHVYGCYSIGEMRDILCLPAAVIGAVLKEGLSRKLFEEFGAADGGPQNRYRLTAAGREFAEEALDQNQYLGPAPVPLSLYRQQVAKQAIGNETVTPEKVRAAFSDLVISEDMVRRLGPAINSGKSMLLYGPPGNGKTTIAETIGKIFESIVFIPYCIEVGGEIITIFDSSIHVPLDPPSVGRDGLSVRREDIDRRWVACHRPMVITGGELTLEMLDLKFNAISKFYEAPLHVKAQGGVFVVDDFGRQLVRPEELLNRWIIPLERRIDFLKLHTGRQFEMPFDQLVIFSTNLTPSDLVDAAFLRRIPYKLVVEGPDEEEFLAILERVCVAKELDYSSETGTAVVSEITAVEGVELACYQAKFVVDQITTGARYEGIEATFSPTLLADAVANMFARD